MNNEVDKDFIDINQENKYKNYIIVGILYLLVIILVILLILGLKSQKNIVEHNDKIEGVINEETR